MSTPTTSPYAALWCEPGARRLLVLGLLARLPVSMNALGLLLLLEGRAGLGEAAVALAVFTLSFAVLTPVVGGLADRRGPRRVLLPLGVVHPALLLLLVAVSDSRSTGLVLAVAALAGASTPPAGTCGRALWPRVARSDATLATAYAADAVTTEVVWLLGPVTVGLLVALAGPGPAVVLTAAITCVATLLVAGHPAARAATGSRGHEGGSVLREPVLRALLGSSFLLTLGIGVVIVAIPAYADSDLAAGLLVGVWGVGSAVSGLVAGRVGWQGGLRALVVLYAAGGLLLLPLAALPGAGAVVVALLLVLAGLPLAPINLVTFRSTARVTPLHLTTTAFAWLTTTTTVGICAGEALAGLLLQDAPVAATDLRALYLVAAAATGAAALLLLRAVAASALRPGALAAR